MYLLCNFMFTYKKAEFQDIPAIEELMDLSISKVLGKLTDKGTRGFL